MTAWLSGWLRDIILIILFAAFVDLLIPNNALQRYVKVAISLMILLTILSPVIRILKADFDVQQAAEAAYASVPDGSGSGGAGGGIGSLDAVLEAGGKLRLDAESRSSRLVEAQMEAMIRDRLKRDHGVYAARVDVRIGPASDEAGASGASAEVKAIRIVIGSDEGEVASSSEEAAKPVASRGRNVQEIARIEPVVVSVEAGGKRIQEPDNPFSAEAEVKDESPNRLQLKSRIQEDMRGMWGIEKSIVTVDWAENERTPAARDAG